MNFTLRKQGYYIIFGIVFFGFWFLFKLGGLAHFGKSIISAFIDVSVCMVSMVITNEFLIPRLLYKTRNTQFTIFYILLILTGGCLIIPAQLSLFNNSIFDYQKLLIKQPQHFFYWFWSDLILGSYFLVFFISATGAAIRLSFDRLTQYNKAKQLEAEKASSELELLKEQINPHFLFNALNTIYYKIDRSNTSGRETLQRFSSMLRYQLYDCDKPFVEIENELSFIKSYIELQRERLNKNYIINYRGLDDVKHITISPFLLLPIVENCFKHVSDYPVRENIITIDCIFRDSIFLFRICNTITPKTDLKTEGIGLVNVKRRLQLIYPEMHELIITETPDTFEAILKLTC